MKVSYGDFIVPNKKNGKDKGELELELSTTILGLQKSGGKTARCVFGSINEAKGMATNFRRFIKKRKLNYSVFQRGTVVYITKEERNADSED